MPHAVGAADAFSFVPAPRYVQLFFLFALFAAVRERVAEKGVNSF